MLRFLMICIMFGITMPALADAPRVAVFEFEAARQAVPDAGSVAQSKVETMLVQSGFWTVITRDQVNRLLEEQNFGTSGLSDPSTAAEMGKVIGIKYLIVGRVNRADIEQSTASAIMVSAKSTTANVEIAVQVIDSETGAVIGAVEGVRSEKRIAANVAGMGGMGSSGTNAIMQGAFDDAIKDLSPQIDDIRNQISPISRPSMAVARVDGKLATIIGGANMGVQKGDSYQVMGNPVEIRDPSSGEIVETSYDVVAELVINDVGASTSKGKLKKVKGEVLIGAIVRLK